MYYSQNYWSTCTVCTQHLVQIITGKRQKKKVREEGERGSEDGRKQERRRGRGMAKRERGDKGGEKEGVEIYIYFFFLLHMFIQLFTIFLQ
jgi:hypothetical protein